MKGIESGIMLSIMKVIHLAPYYASYISLSKENQGKIETTLKSYLESFKLDINKNSKIDSKEEFNLANEEDVHASDNRYMLII